MLFSVRLLRFSRWGLAQHGLQLITGLNFAEKVSQFVIKIRLKVHPLEL